jgi:hypothetical protein
VTVEGRHRLSTQQETAVTTARLDDVDWTEIDFIDFGSGIGGSLQSAEKRTGGRGVGVEMRAAKVEVARREGRNVVLGDIFDLPTDISVRYVTIDNVLEHLPTMDLVKAALESATRIAEEFVYVRHPSFEDEPYLNTLGLKQFWTDWRDHPSHISLADFMRIARQLGATSWSMHPVRAAVDSSDATILPIGAPPDQHDYDAERHGDKPDVVFARPVYYAWDIIIQMTPDVAVSLDYIDDPEVSDRRPRIHVARH